MLDADPLAPVAVESSHCKLFGTTRAWQTLYDALQVAGGSGYLSTQPYEQRMRDFRVTTIFEGTTEIHSIYPALFMLRKMNSLMKTATSVKLSTVLFLAKILFRKNPFSLSFKQKQMRRAARTAAGIGRSIRILMIVGIFLYRRDIIHHQFFLRRITNLSLYFYGILSMLARIHNSLMTGEDVTKDLTLLSLFTEKAQRFKKQNGRFLSYKQDRLIKTVFNELTPVA